MASEKSGAGKEMSFWDHLEELRGTIIRSALAVVVLIIGVCLFYYTGGPTFNAVDSAPWYMLLLQRLLIAVLQYIIYMKRDIQRVVVMS